MAGLADCTNRLRSETSNDNGSDPSDDTPTGNGDSDETNGYDSPPLAVETEYDSREEFGQPGDSFDDFEDLDVWETVRGTAEPDDDTAFDGPQSLKLTAEDGENVMVERSIETTDLTDHDFSLAVRTSTPDNVAIDIRLVDLYGGYAHHQLWSVTYRTPDIDWFQTNPGVFDESMTPLERDAVDKIQFIVHNTGDTEVWVDNLRRHEKPEKGYVVLRWDDGSKEFYDTVSLLHDEYGVNAVQAVVRQWMRGQREGTMNVQQLRERQEAGDQIVAHGTHTRLAQADEKSLKERLRRDKNWAVQNELEGGHYIVYPHNSFDRTSLDVVSDYYAGGFNQSGNVNPTVVHGFDPLVLPRTIGHDLDISMRCVDLAAEHRQCSILNFHAFDQDNTLDRKEYERLLEHIDSKGDDLEVIDFDDLWTMRRNGH
ncbi:polysaccharide deacetylase family protein [Natronococcus sp. JC468]|uniref:polysaccharide deacetylase family protein n=1 Tax=Natronococcus sp. JC468 TaxID=1961921 RepID=UPI0014390D48|nr:polysaccharide deacetylase family protein [Natronococcus sp. JC468]NKE35253.1 polysaccharide deacetylase family protein [Natronococcus sp. JC468]